MVARHRVLELERVEPVQRADLRRPLLSPASAWILFPSLPPDSGPAPAEIL